MLISKMYLIRVMRHTVSMCGVVWVGGREGDLMPTSLAIHASEALPGVLGIQGGLFIFRDWGEGSFIFRDLGRKHNFLGF